MDVEGGGCAIFRAQLLAYCRQADAREPLLSTMYAMVLLAEWPLPAFYAGATLILIGLGVEFQSGLRRKGRKA